MIFLIRHGRLAGEPRRLWGHTDVPLADPEETLRQLKQIPDLDRILRIQSSDLRRARQTADLLAKLCPGAVLMPADPALRELNFGQWEGLSWPEVEATHREAYAALMKDWVNAAPPGGESWTQLKARVRTVPLCRGDAVVGHHSSLRALLGEIKSLNDEQSFEQSWRYAEGLWLKV